MNELGQGIVVYFTFLGTLYTAYQTVKNKNHITKIPREIQISTEGNIKIQEEISYLKETLNADRVLIYDFHNGEHYSNGRGASKISASFEATKPDVKGISFENLNLPISLFANRISKLLKEGTHYVEDIEDINVEKYRSSYQDKKSRGVLSFYNIVILNKVKEPIAILEVQYIKQKYKMTEEGKIQLEKSSYLISNMLDDIRREQG